MQDQFCAQQTAGDPVILLKGERLWILKPFGDSGDRIRQDRFFLPVPGIQNGKIRINNGGADVDLKFLVYRGYESFGCSTTGQYFFAQRVYIDKRLWHNV